MLTVLTCSLANAQSGAPRNEMPSKYRSTHPRIESDGTVMADTGKPLGWIQNGTVYEISGKVLGVISEEGVVTAANGKMLGTVQRNDIFTSTKGVVVTTDREGVVSVEGKEVAWVEPGYRNKSHGCLLFCFFSLENEEAVEIDNPIN